MIVFWLNGQNGIFHSHLTYSTKILKIHDRETDILLFLVYSIAVIIQPYQTQGGGLFAIPLSKLIANVFGWVFKSQNLMFFQVEGTYTVSSAKSHP